MGNRTPSIKPRTNQYESWQKCIAAEFGDEPIRPPKELEQHTIGELRSFGMSTRAISIATEIPQATVARKIRTSAATKRESRGVKNELIGDDVVRELHSLGMSPRTITAVLRLPVDAVADALDLTEQGGRK
ncbi:hypothetical protein [Brevibacterium aurantiacum]|uniref:Uncharacterized protein n=1 Tax=Brevibacterium aurantiacum TaxID=273384 RepID=A0A3Q9NTA3_BREAU|nr:hypothetical protein [Brevibacterium aurantiacum]AZT92079.1 hypothetical protein CXR23_02070 [Brevibacterium aurantiacum]